MHAIHQLRMFETHGGADDTGKILVTQRQVAQLFDLSASAVARWPIEPCRRDGRVAFYDLKQCLRHRLALDGRPDLATERARLASAQADRAVLDNAERAATLIRLEEAMQVFSTQISQAKNLFLGMAAKLATELCGAVGLPATSAPDLEEIIDREVREVLEGLSARRAAVDLDLPAEAVADE